METGAYSAKRFLILGAGATGVSCARYLCAHGAQVVIADSREHPPGLSQLRQHCADALVYLGDFDSKLLKDVDGVVISPGLSTQLPIVRVAQQRGLPCIGDIELFAQRAQAPVLAVTGSNGKSTVVSLLADMAQAAGIQAELGGNIGTPALDLLTRPIPAAYLLECSSFQLETTHSLDAHAAVVLNVSPDHMDRYLDLAEYAQAKARIYRGSGWQVLNADDPLVAGMAQTGRKQAWFSLSRTDVDYYCAERDGQWWLWGEGEALLPLAELKLAGLHNAANALAALALARSLEWPMPPLLTALRRFPGLPHRTQWVTEHQGVTWYNDSKGTNVGATLAALEGLQGPVILLAGGQGKGADFAALRDVVQDKVRALILFGEDAARIASSLNGCAPLFLVEDIEEAVKQAAALAQTGDKVLLSPACASFDQFKGYAHRGEVFVQTVREVLS